MAKQIITNVVDDLDGKPDAETQQFAYGGQAYEVDLAGDNLIAFNEFMTRHISVGRRVGRVRAIQLPAPAPIPARVDREQNRAIWEWAKREGKVVSDRGRISQDIVDEYHAKAGR